ncbi:hypothetical protein ACVWZR_007171 [Bradyrhizobium sp. i1.3.1]
MLIGQRSRDCHALLHAPGQRVRICVGETLETDHRDQIVGDGIRFRPGLPKHPGAVGDVPADRLPGEKMRLLEHHADIGSRAVDTRALHQDVAFKRHLQSGDRIEHRRLAATGGPDDANELARCHVEGNAIHRDGLPAAGVKNDAQV